MGDSKEKLLNNLNILQELIIDRDSFQKQKDTNLKELANLKPKEHHFINIFKFINDNLILKIIFTIFAILCSILILILFKPLGFNVNMIIYVPLSLFVCFLAIFIYKKTDSILKCIFSLVGILIALNIFKILPIDYFINSIASCIAGMILSIILCLPICLIWYFIKFNKFMATKKEIISKNEKIYEQQKKQLKETINEVDIKLQKSIEKINKLIKTDLHYDYCTKKAIERMIDYLKYNRCDNLKECINLYEKELAEELERERLLAIEQEKKEALAKELAEKERERKEREQREKENSENLKKMAENTEYLKKAEEERKRRTY